MFSTITRLGKIACLPNEIREELNNRLHDGGQAPEVLAWLNGLPEVKQMLRIRGTEITPQNLSNWRQGGYQDWLTQRQVMLLAFGMALETKEMREEEDLHGQRLGERLVQWLLSRFLLAMKELDQLEGEAKWKRMRELVADLAKLRRLEREARKDEAERKEAKRKEKSFQESIEWVVQSMKARGESRSPSAEARKHDQASKPAAAANPVQSRSLQTASSRTDASPTGRGETSTKPTPSQPANPNESSPIKPSSEPTPPAAAELPSPNPLEKMGVPEVAIPSKNQANPGESR